MKLKLHYVGVKLYPVQTFIKEAQGLGVNRCLPINVVKKIKWNDRILLATYEPKALEEGRDGRSNKRNGTAHVFGYFNVTGLSYNASPEFKKALTAQLDVIKTSEPNETVHRQCGSYEIRQSCVIKNSIEDIISKAQKLAEERAEKIKFFVAGAFTPFELTISPINFARGVITVDVTLEPENITEEILKMVNTLENYNKRTYIKTHEHRGRPRKV